MKLSEWMEREKVSVEDLARRLGRTPMQVWRYRAGKSMPRPAVMRRIIEITGGAVTANDFFHGSANRAGAGPCGGAPAADERG